MADISESVVGGEPAVIVRMPEGARVIFWFGVAVTPIVLDIAALSSREPAMAEVIVFGGLSWLVALRGVHQSATFTRAGLTVRNTTRVVTIAGDNIAGGWFENGGGVMVLWLKNGKAAFFDVGDLRYGAKLPLQRRTLVGLLRDRLGAPYTRELEADRPIFVPPVMSASRRALHARLDLLPSEWFAVCTTVALAAFQLLRGIG